MSSDEPPIIEPPDDGPPDFPEPDDEHDGDGYRRSYDEAPDRGPPARGPLNGAQSTDGSYDREVLAVRVPPHSIEAEQAVLGGLLLDNAAFERIGDVLGADDFYRFDHRLIWEMISRLIDRNQPADVVTVYDGLQADGKGSELPGGMSYLNALALETPSAANVRRYAEIVRDRSILRRLIATSDEIASSAFQPAGRDTAQLLDEAEAKMLAIAEQRNRRRDGFLPLNKVLSDVVERIDELYQRDNPSDVTGVATGFFDLDRMTSGLQPGDLVIVAGRPSMGKTAFSLNIAESVAIDLQLPVAVFSMEMGATQLAQRSLCSIGRLDQQRLRTGRLNDDDWGRLTMAIQKMQDAQMFIDETPALNSLELRSRARRLSRECGQLGLIVIDYIQLMGSNSANENRATELSEISRSLKGLAKELKCPVIALSQLNRALEQRPNKRPVMSDLRESGAIEQDADVILFIYRDEVYNEDSPDKGTAEIIISKQRNGPIGTTRLTFIGQYTRFENFSSPN